MLIVPNGVVRLSALCGALGICSPPADAQDPPPAIRLVRDAATVRVLDGERTVLAYRATDHDWKAYVERLCTPSGTNVLLVSPPDHVHHRGLIFALGADDHDYWGEHYVGRPGRQRGSPVDDVAVRATVDRRQATFAHAIDWVAGEPVQTHVAERRQITVRPQRDATLVTWQSELAVPDGHAPVRLWGRDYFGLGARFVHEMDGDGRFQHANGEPDAVVGGDERLRRAAWCAYTARAGGRDVTVAMFDDPRNPRHPATWFGMTKPFAFLAATLALAEEPIELRADAPVRLRYGIALWDGAVAAEHIEELYRRWVDGDERARGGGRRLP